MVQLSHPFDYSVQNKLEGLQARGREMVKKMVKKISGHCNCPESWRRLGPWQIIGKWMAVRMIWR